MFWSKSIAQTHTRPPMTNSSKNVAEDEGEGGGVQSCSRCQDRAGAPTHPMGSGKCFVAREGTKNIVPFFDLIF